MVTVQHQFSEFSKHNPIIATTYNFDFQTIRDIISPHHGIREHSIIVADKSRFHEMHQNQSFASQGLSYFVYPAYNIKGSFHPKVAIGLEEGILKILVGSHNLTEHGVKYNLEITSLYKIPLCTAYEEIIQEISAFIEGISNRIKFDTMPKKTMAHFVDCSQDMNPENMGLNEKNPFFFVHSFEEPILEQVIDRIPKINHVTICVPTLSKDRQFIKDVIHTLGDRATFLIDPKVFSLNDTIKKAYENYSIKLLNIKDNRQLHAKIFIFHTKSGDWTLFGSPNFTRVALWKSAKNGGNVEAAMLLPPSKSWDWKKLFQDTVSMSQMQWSELQSVGTDNQQIMDAEILVESWGYETSSNEGIILSPGLYDGTIVYVRLFGMNRNWEVRITDGMIRFKIPSDWADETRYEVLDVSGNRIASGFLNRTGAIMRGFTDLNVDDRAKLNLWFYMRKLHNFKSRTYYSALISDIPDVPLDQKLWRLGPSASAWKPTSKKILSMSPNRIYHKTISAFKEAQDEYYREDSEASTSTKVRQLLFTMDLLIEGVFYSFFLSEGQKSHLISLARDLSVFFDLPCAESPKTRWDENHWKESYYSKLECEVLRQWEIYGNKFHPDVSVLFNFWLYLNSKTVGYHAFSRKRWDVRIITNKYYQTVVALRILTNPEGRKAAFQRVWDSRLSFLKASENIPIPSNLTDLENCLRHSYDLAFTDM